MSCPLVPESQRGGCSLPTRPGLDQHSRTQEAGLRPCGCPSPTIKPALWRASGKGLEDWHGESVTPKAVPASPRHVRGSAPPSASCAFPVHGPPRATLCDPVDGPGTLVRSVKGPTLKNQCLGPLLATPGSVRLPKRPGVAAAGGSPAGVTWLWSLAFLEGREAARLLTMFCSCS